MSMLGIDTSYWKKDINLANVKADFVYTKATEGNYYVDASCDNIVQQAINNGRKWGVYHFATNQITDPVTEANYFVDNCAGYVGHGLLILDYENYRWQDGTLANDSSNVAWAKRWLDRVYERTGVRPLIYMSSSVVGAHDWSSVINADYGLIVAAYPKNDKIIYNYDMTGISDPNPSWGQVGNVMWQFTSSGRLTGYGGNLDCNIFYGDANVWDAYARVQSSNPTPSPTPTPQPQPEPQPQPNPQPTPNTTPPVEPTPEPKPEPKPDPVPVESPPAPAPTPDNNPVRPKVKAGVIAGAIFTALVGVATQFIPNLPQDAVNNVAIGASGLATLVTFLAAYFKRDGLSPK